MVESHAIQHISVEHGGGFEKEREERGTDKKGKDVAIYLRG